MAGTGIGEALLTSIEGDATEFILIETRIGVPDRLVEDMGTPSTGHRRSL